MEELNNLKIQFRDNTAVRRFYYISKKKLITHRTNAGSMQTSGVYSHCIRQDQLLRITVGCFSLLAFLGVFFPRQIHPAIHNICYIRREHQFANTRQLHKTDSHDLTSHEFFHD